MITGISKLVTFLVILALCEVAMGEPNNVIVPPIVEPNRFLTLKDYTSYAESHNAGLKSCYQQWVTATEEVVQAKTLPDPQLTYGDYMPLSYTPEKQIVSVTQLFPWFGKINARTDAAAKKAEAAKQKYQAARLSLLRDVKSDFYEYSYLARATVIARANLDLLKRFAEIIRTKYATADTGHPDIIRSQVEAAKLETMLKGLEQLREPTINRLKASLNLPADMNLPAPEQEDFEPAPLDYELFVNLLRQKNPELVGLGFEAMAAKSKVQSAEKNFYPDIGIGLQFEQVRRPGSNTQDSSRDTMLMLSLNVPLWQDGYKGGQQQAVAEATSIEQQRVETENNILAKAAQAYYEYNNSIRKIKLYCNTLIPQAEEQLWSLKASYGERNGDFNALLDAQRAFMDYCLSYQRALADNRQKLAELEMLAGTELDKQQ
ncbi:MAG: TolC family protein [Sedimentisphaerales bacterium]|jgi:outer membrane protein TolC